MREIFRLSMQRKKIAAGGELAKLAAPKAAQFAYNLLRVGPRVILRSAFELLRANIITRLLSAIVLISFDTVNLYRRRISFKQYVINLVLALLLLLGGTAGWVLGNDFIGAVLENVVLALMAGIVGAGLFSGVLGYAWERLIGKFVKSDSQDMLDVISAEFATMAEKHKLSDQQIEEIKAVLVIDSRLIREMFTQKDRVSYARELLMRAYNEAK